VLAAILMGVDLAQVLELLRDMDWLPFLAAFGLYLSGALVRAYRWGSLIWALGVRVRWLRLVKLHLVGAFFGMFLPTGVGGDAVKMYEMSRGDHKASAAISSVLVDRFTGLFVLFAIASLALLGGYELVTIQVRILIALVFGLSLVAAALVLQRTWIEAWGRRLRLDRLLGRVNILRELYLSLHLYGTAALLRAATASAVWNLCLIFSYYLLGRAVGIDLSLWYYFLFVPVISVLLLLPSVGGLGIREGATVLLLRQVGVSEPRGLALALAYDVIRLTEALIGACLYVLQGIYEARNKAC
jgi:glycosyltransferase 2 family protein